MIFQVNKTVEILSQTPQTLKSLLGNLSDEWVFASEGAGKWTPFEVVGHYIHAEETNWIPRAELILAQGEDVTFKPFDRFAHLERFKDRNLSELFDIFASLREQSIKTLKSWNLTDEQLALKGFHPDLGEVSLEQLLSTWTVHDLTHIRQIVIVLAKQYTENVGEWRQYLSILH